MGSDEAESDAADTVQERPGHGYPVLSGVAAKPEACTNEISGVWRKLERNEGRKCWEGDLGTADRVDVRSGHPGRGGESDRRCGNRLLRREGCGRGKELF